MAESGIHRVVRVTDATTPVVDFDAVDVGAVLLAAGTGPWTATVLVVGPGGSLGTHEAGRDQVLVVLTGAGWLEVDGMRHALGPGDAGIVRKGEPHAKGSALGMVALAIQADVIEAGTNA